MNTATKLRLSLSILSMVMIQEVKARDEILCSYSESKAVTHTLDIDVKNINGINAKIKKNGSATVHKFDHKTVLIDKKNKRMSFQGLNNEGNFNLVCKINGIKNGLDTCDLQLSSKHAELKLVSSKSLKANCRLELDETYASIKFDEKDVKKADEKYDKKVSKTDPAKVKINSNWVNGRWYGRTAAAASYEEYTKAVIEDYGQGLLNSVPHDIVSFSPNYKSFSREKRLNFWVYLLSAMAEKESNFKPNLSYTENFKDVTGTKVVSRGLFQMSYHSAKNYSNCDISSGSELYDAKTNIECAVAILNKWVVSDKVINGKSGKTNLGGGRYWAVLRQGSKLNGIKALTRANF
jgi:hypothetical protein